MHPNSFPGPRGHTGVTWTVPSWSFPSPSPSSHLFCKDLDLLPPTVTFPSQRSLGPGTRVSNPTLFSLKTVIFGGT